jgi:hypothetical protein
MVNTGTLTYIDPFDNISITYDGKSFGNRFYKKSFIGSRLSYSDVILHSFKVPESMNDDELKTNVEIKMYDDAGLDLQKKYKISYIKKDLDFEESILIEAFAVEVERISESLYSVLNKTKHIDFLALPFLSFSTLYKNKIIEAKNDLFVYIDEHESFLSIYKDGKYLSTKSLINLDEIVKKLEVAGVDITIEALKKHLFTKGLDSSTYERGETILYSELESIFASMLTKINDIVVYNRSVFGFEKVDRIFLSLQNGRLRGAREFIENFGMSDVEVRDFNIFKNKEDGDLFEKIVTSYIYDKYESKDFRHNFTIFEKEPAFYKKESGKVLLLAFFIVSISLVSVASIWFKNTKLENQKNTLQQQYNVMKKTQNRYKKKISIVNKELKEVLDKKTNMDKRVKNIKFSITQIENLRDTKKGYSLFILDVNKLLKKYSLSTTNITLTGKDSMSVEIIAEYGKRDNIAKFMEDLIDNGFIGITTDEIKSDKNIYISKIEIKK